MRTKKTTLRTQFDAGTRFDVVTTPAVPFRGAREAELEEFKNRLLRAALAESVDAELYRRLRQAASEAAGTAWLTPFPLLFLPALFEERALAARREFERARSVRSRSRRIVAELV